MRCTKSSEHFTIHLLNIQGFTRAKQIEIEDLAKQDGVLVCLTETQQKYDKIALTKGISKVERMRDVLDKKGGGLLIAFKENSWLQVDQMETKNADLLYAIMKACNTTIHLVLVYFSIPNKPEDKARNKELRKEIEAILDGREENNEAAILMGDFNGHLSILGPQRQDENGTMVMELINNFQLNLLNIDQACQGMYTWTRQEQKSIIDFVLTNRKCYDLFKKLHIDEDRELLDISDHNVLTVTLRIQKESLNFTRGKDIQKLYYRTDEESLEHFTVEIQRRLKIEDIQCFEQLNKVIREVADDLLKAVYRRRYDKKEEKIEQPWITKEIQEAIKKRKELNRKKRNEQSYRERDRLNKEYLIQKKNVQLLVKEAITSFEKKIMELRKSKNRSKTLDHLTI